MNTTETIGNVLLGGIVIFVFGFVCLSTLNKNETYLAATDCVGEKWEEYEAVRNNIPSVELEQAWYRECAEPTSTK